MGVHGRTQWSLLTGVPLRGWLIGLTVAAASALLIAVPTRLIPNPWFARMSPTRPQDYVFLGVSSSLAGVSVAAAHQSARAGRSLVAGGVGTFLAVGCPVCNKLVVALIGSGAAISWFAPLQPLIATVSIGSLFIALRRTVRALGRSTCAVVGCAQPMGSDWSGGGS